MFKIIALSTKGRTPEEEAMITLSRLYGGGSTPLTYYCYNPTLKPIEYAAQDPVLREQDILTYEYTDMLQYMPKYLPTYLLVTAEQDKYPLIIYSRKENLFFSETCEFGQWCSFGEHTTRFTDMSLILRTFASLGVEQINLQVFSDLTRCVFQ